MRTTLFAISLFALVGCTTAARRSVDYERSDPPAARGKPLAFTPIVTVHGLSYFNTALFQDLQRHFTGPLAASEYRFVIDRIEIDATSEEFAQWTAELHLDSKEA